MQKIKVLNNQSLFDLAIQYFGTSEAVFDIALLNNISVTDLLYAGLELTLPEINYGFGEVVNYFEKNKIKPATEIEETLLSTSEQGISFWTINIDFIVQ